MGGFRIFCEPYLYTYLPIFPRILIAACLVALLLPSNNPGLDAGALRYDVETRSFQEACASERRAATPPTHAISIRAGNLMAGILAWPCRAAKTRKAGTTVHRRVLAVWADTKVP